MHVHEGHKDKQSSEIHKLHDECDGSLCLGVFCCLVCVIVVINTECEGVCYRIYARQKFQIMPERRGFKKYHFIFMR